MPNKKLIKVINEYEDGSKEYIDGVDVENYLSNMSTAGGLCFSHGIKFEPVKWKPC